MTRIRRNPGAFTLIAAGALCVIAPAFAAPVTCADMKARIEKQMAAKAGERGVLVIVPKNLATGRVLGSCENGTQRIVWRAAPAAPAEAPASGTAPAR